MCGLKHDSYILSAVNSVTPCVGVWIETDQWNDRKKIINVTPCVGVWIETQWIRFLILFGKSHPAWVCGLKHERCGKVNCGIVEVTPCVGVWIETNRLG